MRYENAFREGNIEKFGKLINEIWWKLYKVLGRSFEEVIDLLNI